MIRIIRYILDTLLPRYCYGCKDILVKGEKMFCLKCLCDLSQTYNHYYKENNLTNKLSIYFPIENSASFLFYEKGDIAQRLIHRFKYHQDIEIGSFLTMMFCKELEKSHWIKDIDLIIPLPLHWLKKIKRGYNQSDIICDVIGGYFDIPINKRCLIRKKYTNSQTKHSKEERWQNVENIFSIKNKEKIEDKHILLIDDIVTTGASISSCIRELKTIKGIRISVVCLAMTQ